MVLLRLNSLPDINTEVVINVKLTYNREAKEDIIIVHDT